MYLKALELQGYKSFANKVEFVFDRGITAVVGPNGSGKSNVADAIRWVLGEQSYRSLRGKKTEDMIFSGSDGRARLGMASATLILDNSDKWMPIDFSEVTISRRAYRSGENEYYLNGSRVRLRDVAELLARGGMSRQTYTVIGQGMIDRVLSLHSDERRLLFEEAAGIIFHRQKRADALDKLTSTQDNLLRLNDIVQEIEPQLRRLQKQAERAEEFALIKTHLEGLLHVWYGYRWGQSQRKLSESSQLLHESEGLLKQHRSRLQQMNLEIDTLRTEQTEARAQLSRWYSENNQLTKRAEAIQRELAVNEERANQYAAQREEILAELSPLKENVDSQAQHIRDAEAALAAITDALSQAEEALQTLQSQFEAHQAQQREVLARQNAAEAKVQKITTELTQRRTRLAQLGERRDTLITEQQGRAEELARLQTQQQELQERQTQLTAKLTEFDGELLALETQQTQYRDQQSQLNQTAEQLKNQMTTLSRREDALRARLDVLDKLRND
ncbi:MAG: AAA family ATPase, partial [Anaerolineae bacterium]|nr:AAA family ATPase [Anaerolineae bacterium]